jgi:hypothetical protein
MLRGTPRASALVAAAACAPAAALAAVMLILTWRRWPDALVDFGRELYVPWRLLEGEVLYRDIAWFNGPLSAYVNAGWFATFGVSVSTLALANLAIAALLMILLYALCARLADRFAAAIALLAFAGTFLCGRYVGIGNYNYITPYSHELTHGLVLSIAGLLFLAVYLRSGRLKHIIAVGLAAGLVFLTKIEVFVAYTAAIAVGMALMVAARPSGPGTWRAGVPSQHLLALGAAALAPPLVAAVLLWPAMPPGQAIAAVAAPLRTALNTEVSSLLFYRRNIGLDMPGVRLTEALTLAGVWILAAGPLVGLAYCLRRPDRRGSWMAAGAAALVAALMAMWWRQGIDWSAMARPWPILLLGLAIAFFVGFIRAHTKEERNLLALTIAAIIFALALLGKMMLNARIGHYGFVLAMPAAMVIVLAMVAWLPAWLDRLGWYGSAARWPAVVVTLTAVGAHASLSVSIHRGQVDQVGEGGDLFLTGAQGPYVREILDVLRRVAEPHHTLAVLPEGAMLNYLLRMRNPTPHVSFMPPEALLFGEERMAEAFRLNPPDFVVLVDRGTAEYGFRRFGEHYCAQLMKWIQQEYETVHIVGEPPLQFLGFGIELRRRAAREHRGEPIR